MQSMMIASQQQLIRRASSGANNSSSPPRSSIGTPTKLHQSLSTPPNNNLEDNSQEHVSSEPTTPLPGTQEKEKEPRRPSAKRSSSWLNLLNPSYKTRFEEFKKQFAEVVPSNERLVVDYSCALQKEILVHGRIYISLNYFCFYANIFKWETSVVIKCRDITSLAKANTARVIPNAIHIEVSSGEKYQFTSFAARDKTYVMMFRIWQNALLGQQMSSAELWSWVHSSYGDDLGYTSEEEEGVKEDCEPSLDSQIPDGLGSSTSSEDSGPLFRLDVEGGIEMKRLDVKKAITEEEEQDPDTDDFPEKFLVEVSEEQLLLEPILCTCGEHAGKELVDETFPLSPEKIFTLAFTDSRFYRDLLDERKTYDLTILPWKEMVENDELAQVRQLIYTVPLNHALAKSALTTETQNLQQSSPDELYMISSEAANSGVPYCDTFCVRTQYCITRGKHQRESRVHVHSEVIFKKDSWSFNLIKPMIQKNAMQGITDYVRDLMAALRKYVKDGRGFTDNELEEDIDSARACGLSHKSDSLGRSRAYSLTRAELSDLHHSRKSSEDDTAGPVSFVVNRKVSSARNTLTRKDPKSSGKDDSFLLKIIVAILLFLFISNIFLYVQLWKLEDAANEYDNILAMAGGSDDSNTKSIPTPESIEKWKLVLSKAVKIIKLMEGNLGDLGKKMKDEF